MRWTTRCRQVPLLVGIQQENLAALVENVVVAILLGDGLQDLKDLVLDGLHDFVLLLEEFPVLSEFLVPELGDALIQLAQFLLLFGTRLFGQNQLFLVIVIELPLPLRLHLLQFAFPLCDEPSRDFCASMASGSACMIASLVDVADLALPEHGTGGAHQEHQHNDLFHIPSSVKDGREGRLFAALQAVDDFEGDVMCRIAVEQNLNRFGACRRQNCTSLLSQPC